MSYTALDNIRHNGKDFAKGDEVTGLKQAEADRLIEIGVLEGEGGQDSGTPLIKEMTLTELKNHLAGVSDPDEVNALLQAEKTNDPRKGALELFEARLQQMAAGHQ